MPPTRIGRSDASGPDRHDWWTVRFTWSDQSPDGLPGFTYAMRPTREAVVNCAALMLIRGRQRGVAAERPVGAHVRGPQEERWHAVPPPWHRTDDEDGRPEPPALRDPEGSESPPIHGPRTHTRLLES